jgi:hypothetical protein
MSTPVSRLLSLRRLASTLIKDVLQMYVGFLFIKIGADKTAFK